MTYEEIKEMVMGTKDRSADEFLEALIDKAEKYRWHDLRKNPNDLPKDEELCLVVDEFKNYNIAFLSAHRTSNTWSPHRNIAIRQPIAWKEIELFEEVT